jgi:hypothetical protein
MREERKMNVEKNVERVRNEVRKNWRLVRTVFRSRGLHAFWMRYVAAEIGINLWNIVLNWSFGKAFLLWFWKLLNPSSLPNICRSKSRHDRGKIPIGVKMIVFPFTLSFLCVILFFWNSCWVKCVIQQFPDIHQYKILVTSFAQFCAEFPILLSSVQDSQRYIHTETLYPTGTLQYFALNGENYIFRFKRPPLPYFAINCSPPTKLS